MMDDRQATPDAGRGSHDPQPALIVNRRSSPVTTAAADAPAGQSPSSALRRPSLRAADLEVGYRQRQTVRVVAGPLEVSLRAGELACLVGPNGAGKSTLLRTLAGMQAPLAGTVWLHDGDQDHDLHALAPEARARALAVVLTERVDDPHLTVYGLTALGRHPHTDWRGRLGEHDHAAIRQALARTGAAELAERRLSELSDGERQRAMVARALAQEPRVLVLDEPTAFLDLPRRVALMQLLQRLVRETGCAVLLSTHELDLALRLADWLWVINAGGGLSVDVPEAQALGGALAAAFSSDDVAFDAVSGIFRLQREPSGPASVHGDGPRAAWTGRALERLGFQLVAQAPDDAPRILVAEASWRLAIGSRTQTFTRLADLLERLRGDTLG